MTLGMKSTEFWFLVALAVSGAALVVVGLVRHADVAVVVGGAQQAAVGVAYALGRSRVKSPRPYLPPSGSETIGGIEDGSGWWDGAALLALIPEPDSTGPANSGMMGFWG